MASQLQIDQAGLDPGTPGVSRTDGLATGALVTLTNTGSGTTTLFRLLWTPPGDDTAIPSLAVTGDPKVWTFSPRAKRYGTYLVELLVDGLSRERRTLVVRTPGGLVIPALNERGNRDATLDDEGDDAVVDNNAVDSPDPNLAALPFAAWWRAMHSLTMAVDALIAPVRITVAHGNGGGAVTHNGYPNLAEAFAVNYASSFSSVAVYDIEPTFISPIDVGPYTLDTTVRYVLRAARGRGTVLLPELTTQDAVEIIDCSLTNPVSGPIFLLRGCTVSAAFSPENLEAFDTRFADSAPVTLTGGVALFDRCEIEAPITAPLDAGAIITITNCTFAPSPTIVFTGTTPGVVLMDSRSKFLWDDAGGNVTNGAITLEAPP
jgi:hypothetical protein